MIIPDTIISMALFALATSATPGPVNVISAMSGARFGTLRSLPYVFGATASFVAILLLIGFGFHSILDLIGSFSLVMTVVGSAYMLYLAYKIAADSGDLSFNEIDTPLPGFAAGALTQAANPKAWIVSFSAITIYVAPHANYTALLLTFSLTFLLICAASLAGWAFIGSQVARFSGNVVLFNRVMAIFLVISILLILIDALKTSVL